MGTNRTIRVGVSFEGDLDQEPARILIERILEGYSPKIEQFFKVRGKILPYVTLHIKRYFLSSNPVDLAVFLCDQNGGRQSDIVKKVKTSIQRVGAQYLACSVIGIPNPHLERWLIADGDTVKKYFNLDSTKRLPYSYSPKSTLARLQRSMQIQKPLFVVYSDLAHSMNIAIASRNCPDFKHFCEGLKSAAKSLRRSS